eukprot:scaffold54726_cov42-Cyclotella_meneghiniana.AAC.1
MGTFEEALPQTSISFIPNEGRLTRVDYGHEDDWRKSCLKTATNPNPIPNLMEDGTVELG